MMNVKPSRNIAEVRVYLDSHEAMNMAGILRCESVIAYDENGNEIQNFQEVIDNTEYHSEDELLEDTARRLGLDVELFEICE